MASFVLPLHPPQPNPILHHRLRITPRASQSPPPPPSSLLESEEETQTSQTTTLGGCKACGRVEVERGCNGEGRIQGGIATVPGFGWWPIKAYRPCPGFVESGGRYRRRGQSMDEVAFGRGQREAPPQTTYDNADADAETKKIKPGSRRL